MNKRTHNTKLPRHKKPGKGNGKDTTANTEAVRLEVNAEHIEAAAAAMRNMKDFAGGPMEAQISIAIMSLWLCMQGKIPGDEFVQGIFRNMNAIGNNQQLLVEINNTIINGLKEVKLAIPGQDF